ncbi:hypothetical protein [Trujillonella endophytica]|uniref:Uncharacterized protein n=1 Tax=Trujillonella endophytica TaxID=673521 RepID=A0A1H8RXD3_9ACTN|nr:hypothetical protein [Trujillella endophytica]SEO71025.1 hypothetical protein SAMN05660991_01403 [Trujillella endophytica]
MQTRVVGGRNRVAGEVRAAAALMAALGAPVPARAPWLTAVLNARPAHRPIAVVVEGNAGSRPDGLALLSARRRGAALAVTLLGDGAGVVPPGRPPGRLLARDDDVAARLAAGVLAVVGDRGTPWTLSLAGLPLGDPTSRALGALRPDAAFATARSSRLVDRLDALGPPVSRSRAPRDVERVLPGLLAAQPDRRVRAALRATARLHAAIGQVEAAVVGEGDAMRAALLTLVDGADRQPWVGCGEPEAFGREMGAPTTSVRLAGGWLSRPVVPR